MQNHIVLDRYWTPYNIQNNLSEGSSVPDGVTMRCLKLEPQFFFQNTNLTLTFAELADTF